MKTFNTHCLPNWAIEEGFTIERNEIDTGCSLLLHGQTCMSVTTIFEHWLTRVHEINTFLIGYKLGKEISKEPLHCLLTNKNKSA